LADSPHNIIELMDEYSEHLFYYGLWFYSLKFIMQELGLCQYPVGMWILVKGGQLVAQ